MSINESQSTDDLSRHLEAYQSAVQPDASRGAGARWVTWSSYAAAAAATLASATSASAAIIYSGVQNVTVTNPFAGFTNSVFKNIKLDSNGHGFGFALFANLTSPGSKLFNIVEIFGQSIFGQAGGAKKFASGAAISGGSLGTGKKIWGGKGPGGTGNFSPNQTGIAGVKIGANEFGWIRFKFANYPNGNTHTLTIIDWAANTNGPISAGQTGPAGPAVPEPGTLATSMFALGATGVVAWTRRRKQTAAD